MRRRNKRKFIAALLVMSVLLGSACGGKEPQGQRADSSFGSAPGADEKVLTVSPELQWTDPENENLADMLQTQCRGMMVQLTAGDLSGSGVIFRTEENDLLIITAAHVLEQMQDIVKVTFCDGYEAECKDPAVSAQADVAVLRLPMDQIPEESLAKYCRANPAQAGPDISEQDRGCIVMGCTDGVAQDAYEGVILDPWIYMEDYGQYMIWVRAGGKAGMSGGGLFDRQGHYLGVLSGMSEDGEWAVVPLSVAEAVL